VLAGALAAVASLGLLVTVSTLITRRYDRRKLRQAAALHSSSVSSAVYGEQREVAVFETFYVLLKNDLEIS